MPLLISGSTRLCFGYRYSIQSFTIKYSSIFQFHMFRNLRLNNHCFLNVTWGWGHQIWLHFAWPWCVFECCCGSLKLFYYIKHCNLEMWEIIFYCEFKQKGEILRNKTFDLQYSGKKVTKHVVYRYARYQIHYVSFIHHGL